MNVTEKQKRTKVAFIGIKSLPARVGVDAVVERIISSFDHEQFEPIVYCSSREVPKGTKIKGGRIVRIPTIPGKYTNATILFFLSALHALFFGNYDVINVHSTETSFVLPILRLRYKVVTTAHGLGSQVPTELTKWGKGKAFFSLVEYPFMYLSNVRTSVSMPDKEYLEARYKREVGYLPIGIELPELDMERAREMLAKHGVEPGQYMIFTAGRIIPRKGCHFVLEAMQGINDDTKLLIVGDTSYAPEYGEKLNQLADGRVRFCGFIASKPLLFALVSQAKLFLFPTVYEAMAATLLEVAALRTPLIASDLPENRAVLPDQALYFKKADVADLRAKMQWALANPYDMKVMASQAEQWVKNHYTWDKVIKQYESYYKACLE
jgi:glycosyltransferase involved in cell wall biosynthesis